MRIKQRVTIGRPCILLFSLAVMFAGAAFAGDSGYRILYSFQGFSDGTSPNSSLIADAAGNLYGTTPGGGGDGGGAVFELIPPSTAGGAWTETLIYRFQTGSDGSSPNANVIFDKAGNLYGTTVNGGGMGLGYGTVFELTPPVVAGDPWTETVLHRFRGTVDGQYPYAPVVFDQIGNLYGTTIGGGSAGQGTVFELSPPKVPGENWTEKIIHTFIQSAKKDGFNPYNGLTVGTNGVFYGTTANGGESNAGTVFRLTPPSGSGTAWTESVLYSFTGGPDGEIPRAPVVLDRAGNLLGTTVYGGMVNNGCTYGCGVVFELSPPAIKGGPWAETVLYSFQGNSTGSEDGAWPYTDLVFDAVGNLYGTTHSGGGFSKGTVFQLMPPAVSGGLWTEKQLYQFGSIIPDGGFPLAGVRFIKGLLYGTASVGGSQAQGIVFSMAP